MSTHKKFCILLQTFSEEWARLNREVIEEAGQLGSALVWMRSGGRLLHTVKKVPIPSQDFTNQTLPSQE
jgi:hypothetical protein